MRRPDRLSTRVILTAGILAGSGLLPAVPSLAQAPTPPAIAAPDPAAGDPPYGPWVAKFIGGDAVPPESGVTLQIGADGAVSANDGCNSLIGSGAVIGGAAAEGGGAGGGGDVVGGGRVAFPEMASTRKFCAGPTPQLGDILRAARGFHVDGDGLLALTGEDGAVLARFAPEIALPAAPP